MPTASEITTFISDEPPPGQSAFLPGKGPRPGVAIVPYDPAWPAAFERLAGRVRTALGDRVLALDHVGSTSVPGLAAKPVIDIDLTVAGPADEAGWLPDLAAAGFELRVREPWWYEHRALRHEDPECNLHVFGPESPELVRHRLFRDHLIQHPLDRGRYEEAKRAAAQAANDAGEHTMQYNARKERVIHEIYQRAFRAAGLL